MIFDAHVHIAGEPDEGGFRALPLDADGLLKPNAWFKNDRRFQIGARLNISPRTVEVHRANFMRKLGLRGQSDLVRYAVGRGILTVDG